MTFLPGLSSNLHQALLPSPVLAFSWDKENEYQLEMLQAAGISGARCTSSESEGTWTFAPEALQALVTSAYGCMCCFAKEVWAPASVSHFRNKEDAAETKMKSSSELSRRMDNCKKILFRGPGKGISTCLVTW